MRALLAACLVACGGASPQQTVNVPPAPSASASASATAETPPPASVVHFDDLGLTFAVPPGFHVMGDSELVARVNASATPHLQSDLRSRADAKKGLPLLALTKDDLNVTLSVVVVPADATAMELVAHQQDVMKANLTGFEVTGAPKERTVDNVSGAEMQSRYTLEKKQVASRMRLFVRNGVATLVAAVWVDGAPAADAAATALDGLHFLPLPTN